MCQFFSLVGPIVGVLPFELGPIGFAVGVLVEDLFPRFKQPLMDDVAVGRDLSSLGVSDGG